MVALLVDRQGVGEEMLEHPRVEQRQRRVDHVQIQTAIDDRGEVVGISFSRLAGDPAVTAFAGVDKGVWGIGSAVSGAAGEDLREFSSHLAWSLSGAVI